MTPVEPAVQASWSWMANAACAPACKGRLVEQRITPSRSFARSRTVCAASLWLVSAMTVVKGRVLRAGSATGAGSPASATTAWKGSRSGTSCVMEVSEQDHTSPSSTTAYPASTAPTGKVCAMEPPAAATRAGPGGREPAGTALPIGERQRQRLASGIMSATR
ncbi:MAG: hypothetical protein R2748_30615 [Bryobacterales bacterium]